MVPPGAPIASGNYSGGVNPTPSQSSTLPPDPLVPFLYRQLESLQPIVSSNKQKEAPGSTQTPAPHGGLSYAQATKTKVTSYLFPPLKFPAKANGIKDGKPSVTFTASEVQAGAKRLDYSLVAKFSAGRPPMEDIRRYFEKSWSFERPVTVGRWLDGRHVLIILHSESDTNKILTSPTRKIGHSLFRLFRWTPDFSTKRESTSITAWFKLPGLPLEMFDAGFIGPIVSSFGKFLDIDQKTKAMSEPSYARVCVEIDATKVFPPAVWVQLPSDRSYWQDIICENNLTFCSKCRLHGHDVSSCKKVRPPPNHSLSKLSADHKETRKHVSLENNNGKDDATDHKETRSPKHASNKVDLVGSGNEAKDSSSSKQGAQSTLCDEVYLMQEKEWTTVTKKKAMMTLNQNKPSLLIYERRGTHRVREENKNKSENDNGNNDKEKEGSKASGPSNLEQVTYDVTPTVTSSISKLSPFLLKYARLKDKEILLTSHIMAAAVPSSKVLTLDKVHENRDNLSLLPIRDLLIKPLSPDPVAESLSKANSSTDKLQSPII